VVCPSDSFAAPRQLVAALSPDGKKLLTSLHLCCLYDVPPLPTDHRILPEPWGIMAYTPDGTGLFLARGYSLDKIRNQAGLECQRYDLATGKPVGQTLRHGDRGIASLVVSPDGKLVATVSSWDPVVRLWDAATGKPLADLAWRAPAGGRGVNQQVAFSRDSKTLFGVSGGAPIRCWDVATGSTSEAPQHPFSFRAVYLSPHGKYCLAADGGIVWEQATGQVVGKPIPCGRDWNFAFSPNEKVLLTIQGQRPLEVRLWDTATGRPLGEPLRSPMYGRTSIAPDSKSFAIMTPAGFQFGDVASVRLIGPPQPIPNDDQTSWAFAPSGETVVVSTSYGLLSLPVPRPLEDTPERIRLWVEVATGKSLDSAGAPTDLELGAWQQRYDRLQKLGGPPLQAAR
jgi:WD40 repeat protein